MFGSKGFITVVKVIKIWRSSGESNKMRYVYPIWLAVRLKHLGYYGLYPCLCGLVAERNPHCSYVSRKHIFLWRGSHRIYSKYFDRQTEANSADPDQTPQNTSICGAWTGSTLFATHPAVVHYENTPIQIYRNFTSKNWKFSDTNSDIFHISVQNIDCGYSLEPPRRF